MSEISRADYFKLIAPIIGAGVPSYQAISKPQRVSLKTIFDGNGTLAEACAVLNLQSPTAAVSSSASAAPIAAGLSPPAPSGNDARPALASAAVSPGSSSQPRGASPNGSYNAESASSSVGRSAAESPNGSVALGDNGAPLPPAPSVIDATPPLASASVPPGSSSQPRGAAASPNGSDNAESASSSVVASSSLASATGTAVLDEPQRNPVAQSQAPAPGAPSTPAPSGNDARPLPASAAVPSGKSSQPPSAAPTRTLRKRFIESTNLYKAIKTGNARLNHQIDLGQGLPNPIFDQEKDCFKNSIALLMRLKHVQTSLNLQSPNMSLCDINVVLNQGGYYLRKLPLYFDENQKKFFKPEVPTLLAVFLQIKFGVDLPWLHDSSLDFSQVQRSISRVLFEKHNYLPFLILNPFNNNGVPLHCVGLDCRWNKAIVWDPANVNSFEFSLRTLHALCDGRWTLSFRRIWCICARA
jgi:hypothetical protein